jgi:hypothetical protein
MKDSVRRKRVVEPFTADPFFIRVIGSPRSHRLRYFPWILETTDGGKLTFNAPENSVNVSVGETGHEKPAVTIHRFICRTSES